MRWQTNLRPFTRADEVVEPTGDAVGAVYSLLACVNHSCAPNCEVRVTWSAQRPGATESSDGEMQLVAIAPIAEGKECVYNYGPKELVEWDLNKRREHLRDNHGFVCACDRCRGEETASHG